MQLSTYLITFLVSMCLWLHAEEAVMVEETESRLPIDKGLFLDLDASKGVETEDGDFVKAWNNQVKGNEVKVFEKRDKGRKVAGSGRPTLVKSEAKVAGLPTLVFKEQELIKRGRRM